MLSERSNAFLEVFSFLKHFVTVEKFPADILKVLFRLLPTLAEQTLVTPSGLKGYFCLLFWCHHLEPETTFFEILEQLHLLGKKVKEVRVPS